MSTATVTAKAGIAQTVTAQVLNNVTEYSFQLGGPTPLPLKSVLRVVSDVGIGYYDISASGTVTATLSAGNLTITLS